MSRQRVGAGGDVAINFAETGVRGRGGGWPVLCRRFAREMLAWGRKVGVDERFAR